MVFSGAVLVIRALFLGVALGVIMALFLDADAAFRGDLPRTVSEILWSLQTVEQIGEVGEMVRPVHLLLFFHCLSCC